MFSLKANASYRSVYFKKFNSFLVTAQQFCLVLALSLVSVYGWGQTVITQTGNGTYTVPVGATSILVECWGAGGGVGTPANGNSFGGGGGGAYAAKTITVSPGNQFLYTVGNGVSGSAGQDTYFGNSTAGNPGNPQVLAKGGSAATTGTSGAFGGQSTNCIGDVKWSGGNGANRVSLSSGGGGGGAAGTTNVGSNGSGNIGGSSGPGYPFGGSDTGGGGNGASNPGNGFNGINFGGGAGANARSGGDGNNSRTGAQGIIRITVITSPPTISSFSPTALCSAGGQNITISGTNFTGATSVTFNGVAAASFSVTNSTITAVTPSSVTAGVITVTTPAGSASSGSYTVSSAPTITAISPNSRCGAGTVVLGATASAGTINWYAASTGGSSLGTGTSYTTSSISSTTTYFVDATANGCTTASRTSVIATVNNVPSAATLNAPANAASNVSLTPTLSWFAVSGATSYDVYLGTSSPGTFVENVSTTSYQSSVLNGTTGYFWSVVAKNACGNASSSVLRTFTTQSDCVAPANLSVQDITSSSATVSWDASAPAPVNGYEYFVSSSATAPVAGTTPTGTTAAGVTSVMLTLSANSQNYFWVRSNCSATDKSAWSASLYFSNTCTTKYWAGAGSGMTGATTGTDFNTSANWSSTTGSRTATSAPGACDDVVILGEPSITMSANVTIQSLTMTNNGNNSIQRLNPVGNTLTVLGDVTIDITAGNSNTGSFLGNTNFSGTIDIRGNATFGTTNAGNLFQFQGASSSTVIIGGNLTFGVKASVSPSNPIGNLIFNGTGTQTVTWNNTGFFCRFNNIQIGASNNPTVSWSNGIVLPDNILGNLTLNGTSVLDLGTRQLNRNSNDGTLILNDNSTLRLAGTSSTAIGGTATLISGSNFPSGFSTISLSPTSTVEYYGATQTVFSSPNYGNLTISTSGTKTSSAGLTVAGNFLINSPATFNAGVFTHYIGANFTSFGTFIPNSSKVIMNGSAAQDFIEMSAASHQFRNLVIEKSDGEVVLNSHIDVTGNLTFISGNLRLNALNVDLGTTGQLVGEHNGSRAYCDCTDGYVQSVVTIGSNGTFLPGNLGLTITTTGNQMGETTIRRRHKRAGSNGASNLFGSTPSVYRIYDVTPQFNGNNYTGGSNPGLNVNLSFQYLTDEVGSEITNQEGTFGLYRSGDAGQTWEPKSGTVDVNTNVISMIGWDQFSWVTGGPIENPSALPIELVSFQANCKDDNSVSVTWVTASEHNTSHYVVEKSRDGITWSALGQTAAAGNSTELLTYEMIDSEKASGTTYYRMTQFDNDGVFEMFDPVSVNCNGTIANNHIVTYPNPSSESFYVSLYTETMEGNGQLTITDASGRPVYGKSVSIQDGNNVFHIGDLNAAPGMYYIQVSNGTTTTDIVKHSLR